MRIVFQANETADYVYMCLFSISSTISYLPHLSWFSEMRRWNLAFSLPYQFTIENADVYYFLLGVWFYLLAFTKPCI